MKQVRLVVAYDGTRYCGWQLQSNGNTIEAELNKAISGLTGEEIHVLGASRTGLWRPRQRKYCGVSYGVEDSGRKILLCLKPAAAGGYCGTGFR